MKPEAERPLEVFAHITREVASLPEGGQVLVLRQTSRTFDPVYEVEYRGKREFFFLSDLELLGACWRRADHCE